jgi:hypothetical protein
MKILCSLLVVLLFLHLQCVASCLMGEIAQHAEPPCHHHGGQAQPDHDANSVCTSATANASQVLLQCVAEPPPMDVAVSVLDPAAAFFVSVSPPVPLFSTHPALTLRI